MAISTYHIHNVLRTYSTQLGQERGLQGKKGEAKPRRSDWISISTRARRKAVIENVTSDIVHRIVKKSPRDDTETDRSRHLEDRGQKGNSRKRENSKLVFKVIDKERGETIRTVSLENSEFLKEGLEESEKDRAR